MFTARLDGYGNWDLCEHGRSFGYVTGNDTTGWRAGTNYAGQQRKPRATPERAASDKFGKAVGEAVAKARSER